MSKTHAVWGENRESAGLGVLFIIQNLHCVKKIDHFERAVSYIQRLAFGNLVTVVSNIGWLEFIKLIDKQMVDMQMSKEEVDIRRFTSIKSRLLRDQDNLPEFLINDNGIYRLGLGGKNER